MALPQTLPNEIERLLLRPDVSNHVARTFSQAVTPLIERHVKDAINTTLIPAYQQSNVAMHQELSREIHSEILSLKKEIITWQGEALKGSEVGPSFCSIVLFCPPSLVDGVILTGLLRSFRLRSGIWRSRSGT